MGKYSIGARVRDDDGDEGEVIGKRRGERPVRYSGGKECWLCKTWLEVVPVAEPVVAAVNTAATVAAAWEPKVGDRVRCVESYKGTFTAGKDYTVAYFDAGPEARIGVEVADHGDPDGIDAKYFSAVPPFTIEAGKFYRTRDGRKVGPMTLDDWGDGQPWHVDGSWYCDDGSWIGAENPTDNDLIAEWVAIISHRPSLLAAASRMGAVTTCSAKATI